MLLGSAKKMITAATLLLFAGVPALAVTADNAEEQTRLSANSGNSALGVIRGVVRDNSGNPIADATVAIFKLGTTKALTQVRSNAGGRFLLRVTPGKYSVFAVAQGFNPVSLSEVEVNRASVIDYGFKLEKAGGGNTLPERRADRSNPMWVIRSAQISRSIYQNTEGDTPLDEVAKVEAAEQGLGERRRPGNTIVSAYTASGENGNYTGINAATQLQIGDKADVVLAGQAGFGNNAPQRVEAQLNYRSFNDHQLRVNASVTSFGQINIDGQRSSLGQVSFQATDEWRVREGIILVYGIDYSRFIGAGNDFSLSPRLGLQYDIDEKTRFRSSYTSQTEDRSWARAIELEGSHIAFREPVAIEDISIDNGKPLMNKSSRFEFGVERVLDNRSNLDINSFFDMTLGRGVGLNALPFESIGNEFSEFVGNQRGGAQGVRVVYTRRLNGRLTTTGGYSFGRGQQLSSQGLSNPASIFENDFFHSFFAQADYDLGENTNIKAIYRLSPNATVFAIDPFQGRLAIYDPGLSVLLTHSLPTWGLPVRAEAIFDVRNIFGMSTRVSGEEGVLSLNSFQRSLRGGIMVRF